MKTAEYVSRLKRRVYLSITCLPNLLSLSFIQFCTSLLKNNSMRSDAVTGYGTYILPFCLISYICQYWNSLKKKWTRWSDLVTEVSRPLPTSTCNRLVQNNRPLSSCLVPLFQNESLWKFPVIWKGVLPSFSCKSNSF